MCGFGDSFKPFSGEVLRPGTKPKGLWLDSKPFPDDQPEPPDEAMYKDKDEVGPAPPILGVAIG